MMQSDDLWLYAVALFLPFILFFCMRNAIKRSENSVIAFYHALRERYPRGYVKQNRAVVFIRKLLRLDTQGTIHWTVCAIHYIQPVMASSPVLTLFLLPLYPFDIAVAWGLVFFTGIPMALMLILLEVTTWVLVLRCGRIKKADPKYAKRDIRPWRGNHL